MWTIITSVSQYSQVKQFWMFQHSGHCSLCPVLDLHKTSFTFCVGPHADSISLNMTFFPKLKGFLLCIIINYFWCHSSVASHKSPYSNIITSINLFYIALLFPLLSIIIHISNFVHWLFSFIHFHPTSSMFDSIHICIFLLFLLILVLHAFACVA